MKIKCPLCGHEFPVRKWYELAICPNCENDVAVAPKMELGEPVKGKSIKDYTTEEIMEEIKDNHIWLNAVGCIKPTTAFKQEIGEMVLENLENTKMADEFGNKMIIIRINKS